MEEILQAFQSFWNENKSSMEKSVFYPKAIFHISLRRFIRDILYYGKGSLENEYGTGRGRLDLLATFKGVKYPIGIALMNFADPEEAIKNFRDYLNHLRVNEGWLIIFHDFESNEIYWNTRHYRDTIIHEVGC
jgi:hypothetical protein